MRTEWKFYTYNPTYGKWGCDAVLMFSNHVGGWLVTANGRFVDRNLNSSYAIKFGDIQSKCNNWLLLSLKQAINLIEKPFRVDVFKKVGISLNDTPIVITDEIKNNILSILNKRRAFNGDSAHTFTENEFNNFEILDAMVEKNLIKTLDGRKYWIEAEEEKKENQIELKLDAPKKFVEISDDDYDEPIECDVPW